MKKILFFIVALIGISTFATAQVCRISDVGDNVEVFSAVIEDGNTVVVTVGNDSKDNSANVTVTVEVTYKNNNAKTYTYSGKCVAEPNKESIIRIRIPSEDSVGRKPVSVKVKDISGTKCR